MSMGRLRPFVAAVFAVFVSWLGTVNPASAQTCPGDSTEVVNGSIATSGGVVTIPVNLAPCQTVLFDVSTTGNTMFGASVAFNAWTQEATPRQLFQFSWPSYGTVNKPGLPTPGIAGPWVPPYRGTRGVEGLIKEVRLSATFIVAPLTYTVTITKVARPDYNTGGTDFSNGKPITVGTPQYGSLHDWEPGQFYAIELQPQQTVYAKGWAEGSPQYGSNFYIELYDENQIYLTSLVNAISVYGFTEFPGTFWPAMFTHTAANPATYYLRLWTRWYPTHAFQFTIEVPKLKLFLDADEPRNFNPNAPEDDISTYLPGTYQHDNPNAQPPQVKWSSKPPPTGPTPIQTVEVIAAYVVGSDKIVAPPAGEDVTFTLYDPNDGTQVSKVSMFVGMAMNYNDPRGNIPSLPDFEFAGAGGATMVTRPFSISDKTARVTLNVWDFGGFATVFARRGSGPGPAAASMKLPKDDDNNLIPDGGWQWLTDLGTPLGAVGDGGLPGAEDADNTPPGNNLPGDGLSRFEEYRGFAVKGKHVRTDPLTKDVFAFSQFASEGLGHATNLAPLRLHAMFQTEVGPDRLIAPNFRNLGFGGDAPGHFVGQFANGWVSEQRAVGIYRDTVVTSTGAFGVTDGQMINGNSVPGPPWSIGLNASKVYVLVIRKLSPTSSKADVVEEPIDTSKTMQTIAHEFGHNLALPDRPMSCPPPATTVMAASYFSDKNGKPACAWNNIPTMYDAIDFSTLWIR